MSSRLPPFNALRAFEAAARHLSFKAAADELAVTPTAISHQIRGLEDQLGVTLFRRLTRALELTPEAEAMLPKLREGMASIAAAVDDLRAVAPSKRLAVTAPPSFASRWLVPRLQDFARLHPQIELHLASSTRTIDGDGSGWAPSPEGAGGDPELWIRFGSGRYPGCRVDHLFDPAYTAVCSPALLRAKLPLRVPADLRYHHLIHDDTIPDARERPSWEEWLHRAGVSGVNPHAGPHFTDSGLAVAAAMDGMGVALLSRPLVAAEIAAGRLVAPFDVVLRRTFAYYAVSSEGVSERGALAIFRDWLVAQAKEERQRSPARAA